MQARRTFPQGQVFQSRQFCRKEICCFHLRELLRSSLENYILSVTLAAVLKILPLSILSLQVDGEETENHGKLTQFLVIHSGTGIRVFCLNHCHAVTTNGFLIQQLARATKGW